MNRWRRCGGGSRKAGTVERVVLPAGEPAAAHGSRRPRARARRPSGLQGRAWAAWPPQCCRGAALSRHHLLCAHTSLVTYGLQEGGDAEEPPPLSEAERRAGEVPRDGDVPSYVAGKATRGRGGDSTGTVRAAAASRVERVLPETTWTGPPAAQPQARDKPPKPRGEASMATYLY